MRLTNFQAPDLEDAIKYICNNVEKYVFSTTKRKVAENILKTIDVSFSIEGLNRYQSMLLCELKDSYVQQSQRYVNMKNESFNINKLLNDNDELITEGNLLLEESLNIYNEMSVLKNQYLNFKGRKNNTHYKHGIPIEDARYCLPLLTKTNVHVSTTGDKLLNILDLMYNNRFSIMKDDEIVKDLDNSILDTLSRHGVIGEIDYMVEKDTSSYYNEIINLMGVDSKENVLLYSLFKEPNVNVAVAAATSGSQKTPSEILESWKDNLEDEATKLNNKVMGYGHKSIIEHARHRFLFKMSLTTYHQFIRHRLTSNYREPLINLSTEFREPYIPESINKSIFKDRYNELFVKFYEFRGKLIKQGYMHRESLQPAIHQFLLNGDMIRVISSSNCRIDNHIFCDRLCNTAQTEIRLLFEEKYKIMKDIYPETFIKDALPPCVYGRCKEGKLTCGKPIMHL